VTPAAAATSLVKRAYLDRCQLRAVGFGAPVGGNLASQFDIFEEFCELTPEELGRVVLARVLAEQLAGLAISLKTASPVSRGGRSCQHSRDR
jgi:hypothetical protein